jgi:hypothetical protein
MKGSGGMWRWIIGLSVLAAVGSALDGWSLIYDTGLLAFLFADNGTIWGYTMIGLVALAAIFSVVTRRRFWPGVGAGTLVGFSALLALYVATSVAQGDQLPLGQPAYVTPGDWVWIIVLYWLPAVALAAVFAAVLSGLTLLALRPLHLTR